MFMVYLHNVFNKWQDDFQHDWCTFGFPSINTCGLIVYLSIDEYYSNDVAEIVCCVNQLFHCVYDDVEDCETQSPIVEKITK